MTSPPADGSPAAATGRPTARPTVDLSHTTTPGGSCPACGDPLFAWLDPPGSDPASDARYVVDRCENCGLALERLDGGEGLAARIEAVRRQVSEHGEAALEAPNAASFQAGLGTENWSGLRLPGEPVLFTPRSLRLLAEREGLVVTAIAYPARGAMATMFQTILNLLTFNRDFAANAVHGSLRPRSSRAGAAGFAVDALVTVFTAIPVAALAIAMEGGAVLARRGGVIKATIRRR